MSWMDFDDEALNGVLRADRWENFVTPGLLKFKQFIFFLFIIASVGGLSGCQQPSNENRNVTTSSASGIINGTDATGGEPFSASVVGIAVKSGNTESIYCTGTLINANTVITAAHCVDDIDMTTDRIVFGIQESAPELVERSIVHSAKHEKFVSSFPQTARDVFDIGIVQFSGDLPQGFRPAPILPDDSDLQNGATVILAGYGVNNGSSQTGSGKLRYTSVPIAEANYGLTEIRTDETAAGSCNGDSGGPGFISRGGTYYLWGATSRGDANCQQQGIYTKVNSYRNWVSDKISNWSDLRIQSIAGQTASIY